MAQQVGHLIRQRIARGFGATLIMHGTALLLGFLLHIGLARLMGSEEYGLYAFVFSWVSIFALFGKLGFDLVQQRFIPDYMERGEWGLCRGVVTQCFRLSSVGSFALGIGLLLSVFLLLSDGSERLRLTFLIGAIAVPVVASAHVLQGALIAFKRPVLAQVPVGILVPVLLLGGLGILWLIDRTLLIAPISMALLATMYLVSVLFGMTVLRTHVMPHAVREAKAELRMQDWWSVAVPAIAIAGTHLVMSYTDIIMVGILIDTTHSGIYLAAAKISILVAVPLVIINTVLTPYISQLYHTERLTELQDAVWLAARLSGALAIPVFLTIWLLAEDVLQLFGPEFLQGDTAMKVLMVGQLVNVLCGSVGFLMTLTGYQWRAATVFFVAAVANIALNFVLIPRFGLPGAALATALTIIFWNLVLVAFVRVQVRIKSTAFPMP